MIVAFIILGFAAAVLIVFIAAAAKKPRIENCDWIDDVYRPCCRNCAFWIPDLKTEPGCRSSQFCEKLECFTDWDYCCMDYDGIDTEVEYGKHCDPV